MRHFIFVLLFGSLLLVNSDAEAQFYWQTRQKDYDWRYDYNFQALSCDGKNCTVAGMVTDNLKDVQSLMFWRSTDGGMTWGMQDPDFSAIDGGHSNWFLGIQQIDSLNVVGIGHYGLILRTFDGGMTWIKQDPHTQADLSEIHFSDPMAGILTTTDTTKPILTTSDGGLHWDTIPLHFPAQPGFSQCHCFGNGKYSVLLRGLGPIYTTDNNWKTISASNILVDSTADSTWNSYYFTRCNFDGDTIIAYGGDYYNGGSLGAITRSTDKGMHWEKPFVHEDIFVISNMSPLNRDTLLASSFGVQNILFSLDKGKTWRIDSMILDTDYSTVTCYGLDWSNGPVAIYSNDFVILDNRSGLILQGSTVRASVETNIPSNNNAAFYPNPASSEIVISTHISLKMVYIFDMLGREVRRGLISEDGTVRFHLQELSQGIYHAIILQGGVRLSLGKFIIGG